jgi:lipoate-protein ligase A
MARDTALQARAAQTGETVFSIYTWLRPTLSFGRHQPAVHIYDRDKIRDAHVDVVRRPTGGRTILHDREVTYSVTAPVNDAAPLRVAYARINRILMQGLASLGVASELASPAGRSERPNARPCFETPGEGELIARGKKLVGSAQWRSDGALLQHGSILVEDDQSSIPFFAASRADISGGVVPEPATLNALLGRSPGAAEVGVAMFDAVRAIEDADASEMDEDEIRDAALRNVALFLDEEWTWQR